MGSEEQARLIQQNLSERIFEGRKLLIDGVPGTRRPERTPDGNQPDPQGRRQNTVQGRRPGHGSSSEGRKPLRPEWKSQNPPKDEQRSAKPVRKGTESDTRPRTSPKTPVINTLQSLPWIEISADLIDSYLNRYGRNYTLNRNRRDIHPKTLCTASAENSIRPAFFSPGRRFSPHGATDKINNFHYFFNINYD